MHKPSFLRKCYSKRREGLFVQTFYKICLILMIIGGINWGLVGLFQFDFVAALFGGQDSAFSRVIFALVGLAALWCISLLFRDTHGKE